MRFHPKCDLEFVQPLPVKQVRAFVRRDDLTV
jgi:hypothetical protein